MATRTRVQQLTARPPRGTVRGIVEPLALKHKDRIEGWLHSHPPVSCELAFASLFAWRGSRMMHVLETDDGIILLTKKERCLCIFGPLLGNVGLAEAFACVENDTGMPVRACERLPEATISNLDITGVELVEDRDYFDYVYRREDLAELNGRKYHAKRNLIAQCMATYDCTYETFSPALIPEIRDMQERWCAEHSCKATVGLCNEYKAIIELLDHAAHLNLSGGTIRIGGRIEAYTLGSALNDRTFAVHVEKAMSRYKGLYQVINQQFCRHELKAYEFVNREQDVGSPGLRKAKESYFPDHFIKKYVVLRGISRDDYGRLRTTETHCE